MSGMDEKPVDDAAMAIRHELTLEDVENHAESVWFRFAASSGQGSMKRLEVNCAGQWRVINHHDIAYFDQDRRAAVQAYNAAP
jgi:hypothetical protein